MTATATGTTTKGTSVKASSASKIMNALPEDAITVIVRPQRTTIKPARKIGPNYAEDALKLYATKLLNVKWVLAICKVR